MSEREDIAAAVVAAGGGSLVGRVRLQKAVYLLDRLGLGSGFDFDYHHFGPYSRDLDNATADAKAFDLIAEDSARRQSDGASYSIFKLIGAVKPEVYRGIGAERAHELVALFNQTNVTVLELAATVDWLWRFEKIADWQGEIRKRKGVKVQNGRLDLAVSLLATLGLAPPTPLAVA